MDEDTHVIENQTPEPEDNGKKANPLLLGGVVLAILLLFVGVALTQRNRQTSENQEVLSENEEMTAEDDTMLVEDERTEENTPEIVDNPGDTNESTDPSMDAEEEAGVTIVEIEGGNFYFEPDTITVKAGEPVRIVFKNVEGMHDFVVDELNIKTPVTQTNGTSEVEFTADEPGEYEFYCSVGSHRQMGMKGTLIVE